MTQNDTPAQNSDKTLPLWWSAVLDRLEELVLVTDPLGGVCYVNRAFQATFGYSLNDLHGKRPDFFVESSPNHAAMLTGVRSLRNGEGMEFQLMVHAKQGHRMEASVYVSAFGESGANPTHYLCIARDLSQERQLQKQLHEVQRMEAMGRLSRGIARRFSQIMSLVVGQIELLETRPQADAFIHARAERVRQISADAQDLIAQINAFSRPQSVHTSPVDLAVVVGQCARFFEAFTDSALSVRTRLTSELCHVMGVSEELHQLLLNLLNNAREAGALEVEILLDVAEADLPVSSGQVQRVPCARIRVSDNGEGVQPAHESQLFEPYFSTRKARKAAGMGLPVVRATVARYQGKVQFYSAPEQGAVFELFLPLHISEAQADKDFFGPRGKGEVLLLLDDEPFVTEAGGELLRQQGYAVHTLNDPHKLEAALRADESALLIMDMTLPEQNGIEWLKQLKRTGLALPPVVLTTSLEAMPQPWQIEGLGVERILSKPCPARELTATVRRVLDAQEGAGS